MSDIMQNLDLDGKKKKTTILINESLWLNTKKKAWTDGESFSELIEDLLKNYVIDKVRFGDYKINEYTKKELESSDKPIKLLK